MEQIIIALIREKDVKKKKDKWLVACTFFIGASQTNVKTISCRKSSYSCYRRRSIDENCGVSENGKSDAACCAIGPEIT